MADPAPPPGYTLDTDAAPPAGYTLDQNPQAGSGTLFDDFLYGLASPINRGAALVAHGLGDVLPGTLGRAATSAGDYMQNLQGRMTGNYDVMRPDPSHLAQAAGVMLATSPIALAMPGATAEALLPRVLSGAASGAASGAVSSDDPAAGAITGAALGAAAVPVTSAIGNAVSGVVSPYINTLRAAGVTPTPGQIVGGAANRAEQGLTSIPLLGDFIKNARSRAVQQLNRGAINDVLAPIGETLEAPNLGRDAINEMQTKVSDAYKSVVPQAGAQLDPQALGDLTRLRSLAQFMPPDRAKQFDSMLKGYVIDKLSPNGSMTGESFKNAESMLGQQANNYLHSSDADQRSLGGALRETQAILRNWLARANPDAADGIQNANQAFARMLRVSDASTRPGVEPGVFSPAQLQASVKKFATTPRQYAGGNALMQPLADAGRAVLGPTVPDSGTPYRHAMQLAAGLLAAHGGGEMLGVPAQYTAAAGLGVGGLSGLAGLLYSPAGTRLAAAALTARPAGAQAVADLLRGAAPMAATAMPAALLGPGP